MNMRHNSRKRYANGKVFDLMEASGCSSDIPDEVEDGVAGQVDKDVQDRINSINNNENVLNQRKIRSQQNA